MLLPLLVVLIGLLGFSGCSYLKPVVIHPIEKSDIFSIEEGSKVVYPDKTEQVVEKDGWFLSDEYVEEVMKAKIGK